MRTATVIVASNVQANVTGYTRIEISARKIRGYGFTGEVRRALILNKSNAFVASMDFFGITAFLDAHCERAN